MVIWVPYFETGFTILHRHRFLICALPPGHRGFGPFLWRIDWSNGVVPVHSCKSPKKNGKTHDGPKGMDLPSAPIHPCQRRHRQRGEECLPGVQLPEPEEKYRRERPGKSGDRLQAAVLRKQGRALERIAVSWGAVSAPPTGGCPGWSAGAGRQARRQEPRQAETAEPRAGESSRP